MNVANCIGGLLAMVCISCPLLFGMSSENFKEHFKF